MELNVSEIFYSLQGEGGRAGEPSIFIRLQGCSAKHACYASGVRCDTEFESGRSTTVERLLERINNIGNGCRWIVWTGGEPCDQLTAEMVLFFAQNGYKQAIETSGLKTPPSGLDYITVSPKVADHVMQKSLLLREDGTHCDEMRYVRHSGQEIPVTEIKAHKYFLSPHFDGINKNNENINHCISLCLINPTWNLSVQLHKIWNVL